MLIAIVFITFIILYLNFSCLYQYHGGITACRYPFIYTLLSLSAFIVISTELLSAFNFITTTGILISWGILLLFSIALWFKWGKYKPAFNFKLNLSGIEKFMAVSIGFIFLITFITCIVAYPNNWDSMTYHLGRVMHWIQNKNVDHYTTQISRQITQPPLAEYFTLHFRLLSGNDRFANLVQWLFMVGSVATVSLIAKEFGKSRTTQLLAALFAVTIPMGILQSNSTQNDYAVSFFIVTAVLFMVKIIKLHCRRNDVIAFIFCCALAITTKGTALIYLIPIVICFIVYLLWRIKWKAFYYILPALFILAIIYGPSAYRNYQTFNSPFGITYGLNNDGYGVAPMLSNVSKNIAIHLKTPFPAMNSFTEKSVDGFNQLICINTNSPHYNWSFSPPFQVQYFSTQEDSAGNLLHTVLFIVCFFVFIFTKDLRKNKWIQFILCISVFMFLLFCYILKWQIWHCRLHLPMFVAGAVFLSLIVESFKSKIQIAVLILFSISSFFFLILNQSRPWVLKENIFNQSKYDQYFTNNKQLKKPFTDISNIIHAQKLKNIGWVTGGDTWEYPMWVMLDDVEELRMENIMAENESIKFNDNSFLPDGIIVTRWPADSSGIFKYQDQVYKQKYSYQNWSLYVVR